MVNVGNNGEISDFGKIGHIFTPQKWDA